MGANNFFRDLLEGFFAPISNSQEHTSTTKSRQRTNHAKPKRQATFPKSRQQTGSGLKRVKKPMPQGSTTTIFVHPRLGNVTVSHTKRVKRISMSVKRDGTVRLNIPAAYPVQTGLDFLASKEQWVAAALKRTEASNPNRIITPPYNTRFRELVFHNVDECGGETNVTSRITPDKLIISFPSSIPHSSPQVQELTRAAILRALRSEAKTVLPKMVAEIANKHGFKCGKVTVRETHSRWGSCSANDDISLSIFLMRLPDHLIEYIIIHELCHTIYKDHSERFHALAESHLVGREKQLRAELRHYHPDIL